MTTTIIQKRRAVSPVIATVILIAVAVALGIAVAFWASGLTSSFSKYEKLGVSTQYAQLGVPSQYNGYSCGSGDTCWTINLGGQNTGSSDATIEQIQINGVPYPISNTGNTNTPGDFVAWASGPNPLAPATATSPYVLSVKSGSSFAIVLLLESGSTHPSMSGVTFASGQTIQVTIITAAGNNYPASIVLP
jgi:flagellin-like protein